MVGTTKDSREAFDGIIALGSNLGDKVGNINMAIGLLGERGDVRLVCRSRNFATEPWGKTDQDTFVNACISVATSWGPRLIDLDLLVFGDQFINEPDFVLPHPHIAKRAFVLAPLMDIAPELMIADCRVRVLHAAIDLSGVQPLI
jgi:2-amino-4-hydroxy-6-hydroxymethyldihydropteridine diphosphokinase